jgi:hypothetical protein
MLPNKKNASFNDLSVADVNCYLIYEQLII